MHTATRLACKLIPSLREQNPGAHICCYGLYAPMNAEYLLVVGSGTILGGEFEGELVRLVERLGGARSRNGEEVARLDEEPKGPKGRGRKAAGLRGLRPALQGRGCAEAPPLQRFCRVRVSRIVSLERLKFEVPDRSGLAPISKYAHLIVPGDGWYRLVDLRRLAGGVSIFAGIVRLCRFITGCFGLWSATWCWRSAAAGGGGGAAYFVWAIRIFLMGYGTL